MPKFATPCTDNKEPGVVVPMPTRPAFVTMKFVAVEEPMTNWFSALPLVGFTAKVANGLVVPIPTLPAFVIIKLVALEEPTTNWFKEPASGFTANFAHGVVVPMPTDVVAIPPAPFETPYTVKTEVPSSWAV